MVRTARRQAGVELASARPPFMPSFAIYLDQWLVTQTPGRSTEISMAISSVCILLAYYFGWRSSTASALRPCDVSVDGAAYAFSEVFSKGMFGSSRRYRLLYFPIGLLPGIDRWLPFLLRSCDPARPWLRSCFAEPNGLDAAL